MKERRLSQWLPGMGGESGSGDIVGRKRWYQEGITKGHKETFGSD